ncbi:MAG: LPS-assembly protein LptD [Candidatus Azobacteroides sp.]|nr:LPS-assembly protein LptD [Candidatus Azobacteroides sp.]
MDERNNQQVEVLSDSTAITDSTAVAADSVPKKSNAIDAPIQYAAKDSMVMTMDGRNMVYLFGEGSVKYKNMDLTGEYVEVDADSSIVFSTFGLDSIGSEIGYPVFKEGETQYEMKKARYNFKTKKMFITDVITQQGEGYIVASQTKKMPNDDLYMRDGQYTTCDDHEHPHFYLHLTRAKVRPGKSIVTGPAYLVVEDVPLPIAVPFGFFPFTSEYSSGVIVPTYGDEMRRGFSLRDGGYYFAFNDYVDLALTGELYTKGSWGLSARSSYRKRYKYSGNFQANYLLTILGDKGEQDYSKTKDFKLAWTHMQDAKANPFSMFSASVNFSTSSYNRNDLNSIYATDDDNYTQNTKSSSVNYNYRPPNSPFSFNLNASVNQVSRDTMVSLTLPNLSISMTDVYPFRRKEQIGAPKWYEKIYLRYTGTMSNSINTKEYLLLKQNIYRDWKNGMRHDIPVRASFTLFKYIALSPSITYTERWCTSKIDLYYDTSIHRPVPADTTYGFYRIYNYNASLDLSTKLYLMSKPWKIFGAWTQKAQIRHVLTPSVSFSGAPDFGEKKYGYWKELNYINEANGALETYPYSPYDQNNNPYGVPGRGKSGIMNFSLNNNIEMKLPIAGTDSTRKISLIDQLNLAMSYNFLADSMKWSDLSASLRLKLGTYSLNMQGVFDTYTYNENGQRINVPRWEAGKGIGRLRSTGFSYSLNLNTEAVKKLLSLFGLGGKKNADNSPPSPEDSGDAEQAANNDESAPGKQQPVSLRNSKKSDDNYDEDGYYLLNIPWSLNVSYNWNLAYDMANFNKVKREYPYRITQAANISGNISPTKAWSFNFSANYDFDSKKFVTMTCTITRLMHCWSMKASVIPVGPYRSYNFTISVNSSMLRDLKYTQSSSFRDMLNWGN